MTDKKIFMLTTTFLLAMPPVITETAAQTCAVPPTCNELGYTQKESDCSGLNMLKCPFDKSAVFCGGENCSYTKTSLPSGCSVADSCSKDGKTYYADSCSICYTGYSLTSSRTCSQTCTYEGTSTSGCADYDSCERGSASGTQTYYYCTKCQSGYYLDFWDNGCTECTNYCNFEQVRTSGPYTDEECAPLGWNYGADSYTCSGTTYYGCRNVGDICWVID